MNSFIITGGGLSLLIDSKPYVVSNTHENFDAIMDAVRAKEFSKIPSLISKLHGVAVELEKASTVTTDVVVDVEGGIVTCQGTELPSTLAKRMIRMVEEKFDIAPLSKFIVNLFNNPSNSTIEELYAFLEYGKLPITEDGFFVAYKKIRCDWRDCHTASVLNQPASTMTSEELDDLAKYPKRAGKVTTRLDDNGETEVSMLRRDVDDRSQQTCSHGLHFCSYEYLQAFGGDRVVAVKINPADVVAIPVDYNNTKGRCSKYVVLSEITGDEQSLTEKSVYGVPDSDEAFDEQDGAGDITFSLPGEVMTSMTPPPVAFAPSDNPTVSEEEWYLRGHADGRKKQAPCIYVQESYQPYYDLGYKHGRGKQRKLYSGKLPE